MNSFTAKFKIDGLNVGGIVTPLENGRKFRIELVTGDRFPIILIRSSRGKWVIESRGKLNISDEDFQLLGKSIDNHINKDLSDKS